MNIPDNFKIIFSCVCGSHLYGTATENSDIDERGVFIPSKDYFFGLKHVEQFEDRVNDIVYWDIRKFFKLTTDNNPGFIELLFIPENKWLIATKEWRTIIQNRNLFLSKKARFKFSGYAMSQLRRINSHRSWLLYPPQKKPEREDYGLPLNKSLINSDQIGAFNVLLSQYLENIQQFHPLKNELDNMAETHRFLGMIQSQIPDPFCVGKIMPEVSDNFLEALGREKKYKNDLLCWNNYQSWKLNRNKDRAVLEEKFGYDTKHGSHLYRLITEAEELLLTGHITFPRPDVELLQNIKNGEYTYDQLMNMVGNIDLKFDEIYKKSILQNTPNFDKIEKMCIDILENSIYIIYKYWEYKLYSQ